MKPALASLFLLSAVGHAAAGAPISGDDAGYTGSAVCAGCHKTVAATQAHTAMARTWQGKDTKQLPPVFSELHAEKPDPAIEYTVKRNGGAFSFAVKMPGEKELAFPIETTMGGTRHGLSFLYRVPAIDGVTLPRAPLVEGRYLQYAPAHRLERSPGFPEEKPTNYETALGRVLTPHFEQKCLTCHGAPRSWGTHVETGVTCENCHGPGQAHLKAVAANSADKAILNPKKLAVQQQMQSCVGCHSGFSVVEDPLPDDLLISDQVTSLANSECSLQSGGKITCTNCHNPHEDASRAVLIRRTEATCLTCHSAKVETHAALCPVNRQTGCTGCHMPEEVKAPLRVADHWIRVHPEQHVAPGKTLPEWLSKATPQSMYLRMLVAGDRAAAEQLHSQLATGASFFDLARTHSLDQNSRANGGFLGRVATDKLDPAWAEAVLRLRPGELSAVLPANDHFVILERPSRNFREDSEARFNHAMELRRRGDRQQSAAELVEALKIYPQLLRGLTYLGVTYAEAGDARAGAGILNLATKLYPEDAGAHFNLAIAEGVLGDEAAELAEYKRSIEIDPDLVPAYLNLGGSLFAKERLDDAVAAYRKGIEANPLIAALHYSLGVALEKQGSKQEAEKEFALALKIDPSVAKQP